MIRLAHEYDVSFERCIERTGLTQAILADPLNEIEGRQELAVLRNILRVLGPDVPFALEAGLRYHVTTHGMWGLAMVSSANIRSAIELGVQYFELTASFNRIRVDFDGPYLRSFYDAADNPDDLQAALIERDLAALITLEREGLGRVIPIQSLELRSPPPAYAHAFKSMFGVTPTFNAAANCITVETKHLDASGPLADEFGVRFSETQCRALLERSHHHRSGIAGEVRRRLLRRPTSIPSMATVAAEFGTSTRTLRNRLGREGNSYRKLLEEVRLTLAEELLSSGLSIEAVAAQVGYADASSFCVAFKRWTGVAPRSYRSTPSRRSSLGEPAERK